MNRKIVKSLLLACVICILTVLTVFSVSAKTVTKNKLVYEVSGKNATLVECKNNAKKITVPSKVGKYKVTAIGEWAFSENKKLTDITLPSTITKIGKAAFNECSSLKKIVIPSSVKRISASAFWYCTSLETVIIPKSVKTIGKNVFEGCGNLTAYVVKGSKAEKYIKKQENITLAYRYMTSLTLNASSLELTEGDTATLTATKKPARLYNSKVSFASSNKNVAAVTAKGVITAKGVGTAVITCSAKDGSGKKATCTVTVTAKAASLPTVTVPDEPVKAPEKVTALKVSGENATGYTLSWYESAESTGYIVSRYNPLSKTWSAVVDTDKTSCVISGRPLGSRESYRVAAYALDGDEYIYSEPSDAVTALTAVPSAVTELKVTKVTDSSISLSWSKANNATGYKIYLYDSSTKDYTYKWATESLEATISGLSANTDYSIAVKSYLRAETSSLDCEQYSETVSAKTLPGMVAEITAKDELIYPDSLTLSWNEVAGADGYNLYIYDKTVKAYKLYSSVQDLTCEVTGLEPNMDYHFKVRTYTETAEGSWSDRFTFKTDYIPETAVEAAESFIDALSATKNLSSSFILKATYSVTELEGDYAEEISPVIEALCEKQSDIYTVENGIETATGKTVSELIYPYGQNSELSIRDIDTASLSFTQDGYGHNMTFGISSDSVFEIACPTDFDRVAKENEGFILTSFENEDGIVQAKITDGVLSYLKVKVPVKAGFRFNGQKYEISYTISQDYLFL